MSDLTTVVTALRNSGVDVKCAACMALALTGVGLPGDQHTCKGADLKKRLAEAEAQRDGFKNAALNFEEALDNVRQALGLESTHYLVIHDEVREALEKKDGRISELEVNLKQAIAHVDHEEECRHLRQQCLAKRGACPDPDPDEHCDCVRSHLLAVLKPSDRPLPICHVCGAEAACFGRYEQMERGEFTCDDHCAHGCEDGQCVPVAAECGDLGRCDRPKGHRTIHREIRADGSKRYWTKEAS